MSKRFVIDIGGGTISVNHVHNVQIDRITLEDYELLRQGIDRVDDREFVLRIPFDSSVYQWLRRGRKHVAIYSPTDRMILTSKHYNWEAAAPGPAMGYATTPRGEITITIRPPIIFEIVPTARDARKL